MTSVLTVLGSCGAWPEAGRACSGFLLEHEGYRVVLDLGYRTATRLFDLLGSPVAEGLDAVVITHRHPDHMIDLHTLFQARAGAGEGGDGSGALPPLPVYATDGVRMTVRARRGDAPGRDVDSVFRWHELPGSYDLDPFRLTARRLPHVVPNAGVRLDAGSVSVAYNGGCGPSPELVELVAGVDLFIAEASDRYQRVQVPASLQSEFHLDGHTAGDIATAAGARRMLLTHFWPGNDRQRTLADARRSFDGPIALADEGLRLPLSAQAGRADPSIGPRVETTGSSAAPAQKGTR